ncbi:tyrosine-type recombinase/integrase [Cytobacillus oceanisediminis]|uniref:tyrosine-type recombinase/integrase n=1 Tax=Bacillaceae TaxID=186817 RepID=UPI001CCF6334|nr:MULTISPECIES: tyrosine-type recombinase/integrase [Bacillaceae]MBZ9536532.1 tyrosine-type recombinase/integrase [Cytobacillus oceanisediminis]UTI43498.1 tyrosine-type recombinase/integrase [Niallia sp. RD1]
MEINSVTFSQAIEGFKNYLIEKNRSSNTIKSYVQDLHFLESWLSDIHSNPIMVHAITKTDIKDFEREIKLDSSLSPATINRRLVAIKKWADFLVESKFSPVNLSDEITIKKVQKQNTIRWLTRQEVGRLLHAIELTKHSNFQKGLLHETLVILLVNLGLRIDEACSLTKSSVSFRNGIINVIGKGDKHRVVPLTEKTKAHIQMWLEKREKDSDYILISSKSNRLSARAAQHILKKYSNQLGIEITPHSLRHTYCKQLANSGVGLQSIAELAGHSSMDTTRIYVTPSIKELQTALKKTEF